MTFRRAVLTVAAGLSLTALAACTVEGTPTRGPVDLDTGKYSTKLASPAGEVTSDADLDKLLGLRLGESIVFHDDVDPALDDSSMPTYPITRASGLAGVINDVGDKPFMKGLHYGFSVGAQSKKQKDKGFNHAVLVFDSPAAAVAGADGLAAALRKESYAGPRTDARLAGAPADMRAVAGKTADGVMTAGFTPVGDKVIYTWADAHDKGWTENIVRVSYEKQKALLDSMKPISDDRKIDPGGLLRGVLPADSQTRLTGAVLGPRTVALLANTPSSFYKTIQKADVTAAVVGGALVFKTGGDEQANALLKDLSDQSGDPTSRKAASPRDLPSAACFTSTTSLGTKSADCYLTVGRYAVQTSAETLLAAQQMAAAEVELLKQL